MAPEELIGNSKSESLNSKQYLNPKFQFNKGTEERKDRETKEGGSYVLKY